jgi:hypothetical protein
MCPSVTASIRGASTIGLVQGRPHRHPVAVRFVFDKRKGFTKIFSGMCPFLRGILVFTTYKTDMTLYI